MWIVRPATLADEEIMMKQPVRFFGFAHEVHIPDSYWPSKLLVQT
jgi:putative transposon-encoded protein